MKKFQMRVATIRIETQDVEAEHLLPAMAATMRGCGVWQESRSAGLLKEAGVCGVLEVWERDSAGDLHQVAQSELEKVASDLRGTAEFDADNLIEAVGDILERVRADVYKIDKPYQRAGALMALDEVRKQVDQKLRAVLTNRVRAEAGM